VLSVPQAGVMFALLIDVVIRPPGAAKKIVAKKVAADKAQVQPAAVAKAAAQNAPAKKAAGGRGGQETGGGGGADSAPDTNSDVQLAFALGWQMAQLFHEPVHESEAGCPPLGDRLPGISGLGDAERSVLLARQIDGGVTRLLTKPERSDPLPSGASTEELLQSLPRDRTAVRSAIWNLHACVLEALNVSDFRLGKSYGLGRALAETVLVPANADALDREARYHEMFDSGRLLTLTAWLSQLKTTYPPHAAYAVSGSLARWAEWVNSPDQQDLNVGGKLKEQGRLWRAMLSGELAATDLLIADSYFDGALALATRVRKLVVEVVKRYYLPLAILALIVAAVVAGVWWIPKLSSTDKFAGDVVAVVAGLGITTKGATSAIGRTLAKAESPLWDSEVDESCALACSRLPTGVTLTRRPADEIGKIN